LLKDTAIQEALLKTKCKALDYVILKRKDNYFPMLNEAPGHEDIRGSGGMAPGINLRWFASFSVIQFIPGETANGPISLRGMLGPTAILNAVKKRNILPVLGSIPQPGHYTD
jgi:hypothetical protein